jgi:lycopene beta-cyclase
LSYWQFLALFLGIPLLLTVVLGFRGRQDASMWLLLAGISVVALLYTGPWDNLIVANGVWSYGPQKILGPVIGRVPIEEYAFYVLQVFLTGLLTIALLRHDQR